MLSIIKIIYFNMPIDYVHYHTSVSYVLVLWYWSMIEELRKIITYHIISSTVDPDDTLIG